jgi:hypothetical protein
MCRRRLYGDIAKRHFISEWACREFCVGGVRWRQGRPTYSCINCLRTFPYVEAWAAKSKDQRLVVIGVHSPEFNFEKDVGNVRQAVNDLEIVYPVAIDSNYAIWRALNNDY